MPPRLRDFFGSLSIYYLDLLKNGIDKIMNSFSWNFVKSNKVIKSLIFSTMSIYMAMIKLVCYRIFKTFTITIVRNNSGIFNSEILMNIFVKLSNQEFSFMT